MVHRDAGSIQHDRGNSANAIAMLPQPPINYGDGNYGDGDEEEDKTASPRLKPVDHHEVRQHTRPRGLVAADHLSNRARILTKAKRLL